MTPPRVLIERSVITALQDPTSEHHRAAVDAYLPLLEQFAAQDILLVAVSDHLRPQRQWFHLRRRGPLAAIDSLAVGRQHRRAARRMSAVPDFDEALTLVMCQRHGIARVLTFSGSYQAYDLVVDLISR